MTNEFTSQEVPLCKVNCTGVKVKLNPRKPTEVERIDFTTSKGNIRYKPKVIISEFQNGIEIEKTVSLPLIDLPEIVKTIGEKLSKDKNVDLNVTYMHGSKEVDGETAEYRYLTSMDMLNKWSLI
jgi:hypothetical protein